MTWFKYVWDIGDMKLNSLKLIFNCRLLLFWYLEQKLYILYVRGAPTNISPWTTLKLQIQTYTVERYYYLSLNLIC
jgi:hypothetical protein